MASSLASQRHVVDDLSAMQELFHSRQWTDGLPIVPPTAAAVQACLDWVMMPGSQLIGVEPVRGRAISAEKLAINAVMAGCLPMHFPVLVAAVTAMLDPAFLLHGVTSSTGGSAVLIVVNGPIRDELSMNGSFNVLGSTDRATTCIGRAVRLVLINVLDVRPGDVDRSTLGHPGKISYCLAEDESGPEWSTVAEQRGLDRNISAVTVLAAGAPRQLMNEWTKEPADILDTFAGEIKANMRHYSIWSGNYAIVVPSQLRTHFLAAGWSTSDVQNYLYEHARIKREEWADCGKANVVGDQGELEYRALPQAEDLLVVSAGGPAGGFGAVIAPWLGTKSRAVTVAIGACVDCEV